MRTHTEFVSFTKLAAARESEAVVTLALVCNDMAIANSSMSHYSKNSSAALVHIRRGARIYFSKMICGHLNEGMLAVEKIKEDPYLNTLVKQCGQEAQEAFAKLCECLRDGSEAKRFEEYVGWVRNRVAFHYDPNDIRWAVQRRAQNDCTGSLTAGEDIHTSRFEFGDDIIDTIVVRKLWKIPEDRDARTEADRIGDWCDQRCREFLEFSRDYVPRFLRAHAAAG